MSLFRCHVNIYNVGMVQSGESMKNYAIPISVQSMLQNRVNAFCKQECVNNYYCADTRGKFIYLGILMPSRAIQRLGRLTYRGDLENMEFAILKHSLGKYD